MSEVVSHKENKASEVAKFFSQNELLADPVTRRDYFEHLDEQDFLGLVQQTANLVRTGDPNHLQHFDGTKVGLMFHEVPDQREKEALLTETWRTVQSILRDRELSDQDVLDYAGLTVAGGILLAHPFIDGNGRTSRTLSHVMMRGTENSNELQTILAESSNAGGWAVAPEVKIGFKRTFKGEQPDIINWEDSLAGEGEDAYGGSIANSAYKDKIVRGFIENADDEAMQLVRQAMKSRVDRDAGVILDADKLLEILAADDGASYYAQQLFALLRKERIIAVHAFLESMQNGELIFDAKAVNRLAELKGTSDQEERAIKARREIGKRGLADDKMVIRNQHLVEHVVYSGVYDEPKDNLDR